MFDCLFKYSISPTLGMVCSSLHGDLCNTFSALSWALDPVCVVDNGAMFGEMGCLSSQGSLPLTPLPQESHNAPSVS